MFRAKNYVKVQNLAEAYELNKKKNNAVIGGMRWLSMSKRNIGTIIDLSGLGLNEIEETEEEFRIGCMCTLRQLELHPGLQEYFHGEIKEMVRHIVGTQFRNGATVGGSVYGRYGFSDVITGLLVLGTWVELYHGGKLLLSQFVEMGYERDILVRIVIPKDGRRMQYGSHREAATDFPVIACGVARKDDCWYISVGARPGRGKLVVREDQDLELDAAQLAKEVAAGMSFESNMRGSAGYRKHLAEVYIRRGVEMILAGGDLHAN
ncbi:MAG: FAD binding domain-containing protein [Lachnospiraceae bacterium]